MAVRPEAFVYTLALVIILVVQRPAWPSSGRLAAGLALTGLAGYGYQENVVGRVATG